jgi:hypothetical protein
LSFPLLDPDARHKLTHPGWPGVEFALRPVPRGRWSFLRNSILLALEKTKRRAVRDLTAEGVTPDVTATKLREMLDPAGAEELATFNTEIVRWSLIEISGAEHAGAPLAVKLEEVVQDGIPVHVLSRETLRLLSFQPGLVPWLANEAWSVNELGVEAKKS